VALPAFAAARRVEAQLLLTAGRAAISRYLLAAANPQQRRAAGEWNGRTDDSCIDPAPHIVGVDQGSRFWDNLYFVGTSTHIKKVLPCTWMHV